MENNHKNDQIQDESVTGNAIAGETTRKTRVKHARTVIEDDSNITGSTSEEPEEMTSGEKEPVERPVKGTGEDPETFEELSKEPVKELIEESSVEPAEEFAEEPPEGLLEEPPEGLQSLRWFL